MTRVKQLGTACTLLFPRLEQFVSLEPVLGHSISLLHAHKIQAPASVLHSSIAYINVRHKHHQAPSCNAGTIGRLFTCAYMVAS
jgi:hypothetical protein